MLANGWSVSKVQSNHNNTHYIFDIEKWKSGELVDKCRILLDREGHFANVVGKSQMVYQFSIGLRQTDVRGTAKWLADIDNFTSQLDYIIERKHNK